MRRWRALVLIAVIAPACQRSAAIGVAPRATPTATVAKPPAATTHAPAGDRATVVRVVDGDTVVLTGIGVGELDRRTGGRKARLIGVDTPEVYGGVECLGREASAFTRRELEGRDVVVIFDVDPIDRYGRALVYVWTVKGFFNERLVAEGFAQPMTVPPNVRYADVFVEAARRAREQARGLWSLC